MKTASGPSQSTPFIYIKLSSKKDSPGERVVIPQTLDGLKKKAKILLRSKEIQAFFTEDGQYIESIDQIAPSTTLIASEKPYTTQAQRDALNREHDDDEDSLSYDADEFENQENKEQDDIYIPIHEEEEEEEDIEELKSGTQEIDDEENQHISFVSTSQVEQEPSLLDDIEEEEEKENESTDPLKSDDDLVDDSPPVPEKEIVERLLGPQYCNEAIQQIVMDAYSQADTKNFMKNAMKEEQDQQRFMFQKCISSLSAYNNLLDRKNLTLVHQIEEKANGIVNKHRVLTTGCVAYNFNTVITGPHPSGKSTFLAFVTEQFLTDLVITNTWKRNFVLIFDAKKLAISFSSYLTFYDAFIDLIFGALKYQRPGFIPYADSVTLYFHGITQEPNTQATLPKTFSECTEFRSAARSLALIGSTLKQCFEDTSSFSAWFTNVLLLPKLISSAFGFDQIHFIIDHIDYLDVQFQPAHPFVDSSETVDLVEYFKYVLSTSSYILACEDTNSCISSFGVNGGCLDILRNSTLEDVFGLEGEVYGSDKEFNITFEDQLPFRFTVTVCNGCPAYLDIWAEMCRDVDRNTESWNVDPSQYNEHQEAVKHAFEYFLRTVFVSDSDFTEDKGSIVSIKPITSVA